jgi:hypothetical protein
MGPKENLPSLALNMSFKPWWAYVLFLVSSLKLCPVNGPKWAFGAMFA